ncbi:MAG: ImuA protein [Alphaproteobacteria bacterium]|nr:ImuA protein [Alphaproteobacteria bacterium]
MEDRRARLAAAQRLVAPLMVQSERARHALGCAPIDTCLQGGLIRGAMHEVAAADHAATPAAMGFLLALAAIAAGSRPLVWVLPRHGDFGQPYGPGMKAFGLDPGAFVFLRCASTQEQLWALEEVLRAGAVGAVIGTRPAGMDLTASRRLHLAAETGSTPLFLLRAHQDHEVSAAVTRWRIQPQRAATDSLGFLGAPRFAVALERVRAGKPGTWVVEWDHAALCLRLPAGLQHRVPAQDPTLSAA